MQCDFLKRNVSRLRIVTQRERDSASPCHTSCIPVRARFDLSEANALHRVPLYASWSICQSTRDVAVDVYIYVFSRRFYPKRRTEHSGYTFVLSVCVFPGNRTHNLCAANALL